MSADNSRVRAKTWPYKRYKDFEDELRVAAGQWFEVMDHARKRSAQYILACNEDWENNIICCDVVNYIEQQKNYAGIAKKAYPLHKFLHHGLSSQALAFNLLGPLIVRDDLVPLRKALEGTVPWPAEEVDACFEYDDRVVFNEDAGQPTSLDAYIGDGRNHLFIEVKLSEKEFGGCSVFALGDCEGHNPCLTDLNQCYLHHIGRTYWKAAIKHGLTESELFRGAICPFANYYQFFRELLFAREKNGFFVLLHDERNPAFQRTLRDGTKADGGLWPFLTGTLPDELKKTVAGLSVQKLVKEIENSGRHGDWIGEFKDKYALSDPWA